jgi:hypothetical protein
MANKNKGAIVVIFSLVLIGGGVGYWLWKRKKDKDAEAAKIAADAAAATTPDKSITPAVDTKVETPKVDAPKDVKAFQDWMDKNHPNWVNGKNLNKGGGYGNFGSATQSAWATYKTEYGTAPKSVGGFTAGALVYATKVNTTDTAYSYPSKETRYQLGRIERDGAKPIGTFMRDSTVKDWIQVRALPLKKYDNSKVVQDVFLYNPSNSQYTSTSV